MQLESYVFFFCLGWKSYHKHTSTEVAGSPMWTESQAFGAPPDLSVLQTYEENKSAFKNVTNVLVKCILLGVWINKQTIANIDNLHGWPEHLTETKYNVNCFAWLKIITKKNHNLRWSTSAAHQFSTLVWFELFRSPSAFCALPLWDPEVLMLPWWPVASSLRPKHFFSQCVRPCWSWIMFFWVRWIKHNAVKLITKDHCSVKKPF